MTPATYEEFLHLAEQGTVVPLVKTVMADLLTPVSAYLRIERQSPRAFLLESVEGGEKIARYSFLGCAPHTIVHARGNVVTIEKADGSQETVEAPMLDVLRDLMRPHRPVKLPGLPPFSAGAVGYFGYDAVRWFERLPAQAKDDLQMETACVMFFASLLAFDHVKHQIQIIANVFTDGETDGDRLREKYIAACSEIARLEASLGAPIALPPSARRAEPLQLRTNMTKEYYVSCIEKIKEYIKAGDAFQVVFAQRFETDIVSHPFQTSAAVAIGKDLGLTRGAAKRAAHEGPQRRWLQLDDVFDDQLRPLLDELTGSRARRIGKGSDRAAIDRTDGSSADDVDRRIAAEVPRHFLCDVLHDADFIGAARRTARQNQRHPPRRRVQVGGSFDVHATVILRHRRGFSRAFPSEI